MEITQTIKVTNFENGNQSQEEEKLIIIDDENNDTIAITQYNPTKDITIEQSGSVVHLDLVQALELIEALNKLY